MTDPEPTDRPDVAAYVAQLEARLAALERQRDYAIGEAIALRREQQAASRQWRRHTASQRDDRRAARAARALETILGNEYLPHEAVERVREYLAGQRRSP